MWELREGERTEGDASSSTGAEQAVREVRGAPGIHPPLALQGPWLGLVQLWADLLQDVVVLLGLELLGEHKGFAAHLVGGSLGYWRAGSPRPEYCRPLLTSSVLTHTHHCPSADLHQPATHTHVHPTPR